MARLVVVTGPALADGFRLAGCATPVVPPGPVPPAALQEIVGGDAGLVLVTTDVWAALDVRTRGELERLAQPVVMPIPAGTTAAGAAPGALLGEMLERAIGFRIVLTGPER